MSIYQIHQVADDTNYLMMDTADGQVIAEHNCCPQDNATSFTVAQPGFFPFDNVFGEQGGGDWGDLGISGPGIPGTVALGDTDAGSPPVFRIAINPFEGGFRILEITHDPAADEFTITWTSKPGKSYVLLFDTDLGGFEYDIDDGITAEQGSETTTFGPFPNPEPGALSVFFRVQQQ
jgi:hypothetical protein